MGVLFVNHALKITHVEKNINKFEIQLRIAQKQFKITHVVKKFHAVRRSASSLSIHIFVYIASRQCEYVTTRHDYHFGKSIQVSGKNEIRMSCTKYLQSNDSTKNTLTFFRLRLLSNTHFKPSSVILGQPIRLKDCKFP